MGLLGAERRPDFFMPIAARRRVAAAPWRARRSRPDRRPRLLSKREVLERVGLTYPTLWAWMRKGKFPRSREVGGKIAWLEGDIDAWIANLPVKRLKGDAP